MSRENVEAFYKRLATDNTFQQLLQSVKSKEECSQIVKQHGYEFTQQEWEDYTVNLLESIDDDGLVNLDEKELEAVIGGFIGDYKFPSFVLHYGLPIGGFPDPDPDPYPIIAPAYGLPPLIKRKPDPYPKFWYSSPE